MKESRVNESAVKDDIIAEKIKSELEDKMGASSMDINATFRSGVAHLSGFVDVLGEKKFAESVVRSIDGVHKVENNITISMDSQITDKHIEKEVIDRLRDNGISEIGVKVNDGVVSLMGHIDTLSRAHSAMNIATQVRGVKDVVNNTEVNDTELYDDISITNAIKDKLIDSELSSDDIAIDVNDGIVTLSGYVNNQHEKRIAKDMATEVKGVTKVHNRIQTRNN